MHRRKLIDDLLGYGQRHPAERALVERFVAFVRANERCFERDCLPGHVTGSAWILNPARDAVLLTHHRKLDRWLQPGGHSDGAPDSLEVALREAREESGLDVTALERTPFDLDIHDIPARGAEPHHQHYDVRYLLIAGSTAYTVSDESHDLAWVALDQVSQYTVENSILRMLGKCGGDA